MSSHDNNQQEHGQDLNITAILTTGIAFALVSIVVVMYLYGLYLRTVSAEQVRKSIGLSDEVFELKQGQLTELATSGWIDPEAGIARIPIDEAIRKTVEDYREKPAQEGLVPEEGPEDEQPAAAGGGDEMAGRPGE